MTKPRVTLEVQATDSATPALSDTTTVSVTILDVIPIGYEPGVIYRNHYSNITGNRVSDLTNDQKFPQSPDDTIELEALSYSGIGNDYGATVRAYLIAPYTGNYTFWIASDDEGQLHLSTDTNPNNMSQIAYVSGWTSALQWDKYSSQQSTTQALIAGQVYYLETRHKESGSGDHLAIAWQVESGGTTLISQEIIPALFLAPHSINYTPQMADPSAIFLYENAYPAGSIASFSATDLNPEQSHSYAISGGDPSGIFAIDPTTGALRLAKYNALDAQTTPTFNVSVTATDNGNPPLSFTASIAINILAAETITTGGPIEEIWDDRAGNTLSLFYDDVNWPEHPDQVQVLTNFRGLKNIADNYAARISAFLIPETTGQYTFYIASDDDSTLFISTDSTPENISEIASVSGYCGDQVWGKYPSQTSSPIDLVAGQRYFIEAHFKEGGGGDHITVAWTGPGISDITIIPAECLERYDSNTAPTFGSASYAFNLDNTASAGTVVGTTLASSQPFESIAHRIQSGNIGSAFAIDYATGQITLAQPSAMTPGQVFDLTIGAQDDGYGRLLPLKESTVAATITISGTPVQIWRGQQFGDIITNSQISGDLIDPDNDQICNLLEYALNLNPLSRSGSSNLPQVDVSNSTLRFTYRKNLSATDLQFTIEQATDLMATNPWSAATVLSEETLSDDGETRLIRATLSEPQTEDKRFIRLKVNLP